MIDKEQIQINDEVIEIIKDKEKVQEYIDKLSNGEECYIPGNANNFIRICLIYLKHRTEVIETLEGSEKRFIMGRIILDQEERIKLYKLFITFLTVILLLMCMFNLFGG